VADTGARRGGGRSGREGEGLAARGHRKVTALLRADGVPAAEATIKRALRRNALLLPFAHTR
jgi:transposase InsO family protein